MYCWTDSIHPSESEEDALWAGAALGLHFPGDDPTMKHLASTHHYLPAVSFRACHTVRELPDTDVDTETKHTPNTCVRKIKDRDPHGGLCQVFPKLKVALIFTITGRRKESNRRAWGCLWSEGQNNRFIFLPEMHAEKFWPSRIKWNHGYKVPLDLILQFSGGALAQYMWALLARSPWGSRRKKGRKASGEKLLQSNKQFTYSAAVTSPSQPWKKHREENQLQELIQEEEWGSLWKIPPSKKYF